MILLADIHLNLESEPIVVSLFQQVAKLAKDRGDRRVALLGDIFDVRHDVAARLLSTFLDCLNALRAVTTVVDIVPGNHDQWNVEGRHVLEAFAHRGGDGGVVRVHSVPGEVSDSLVWLPWCSREQAADVVRARAAPFLLGHLAIRGAWMNNLRTDEDGFPLADLQAAGFTRGFFGHYHRHHEVAPGLEYVGSPYQVSYAEAGQVKGVIAFDPVGNTREFIELDVGPRHHKVVVDVDHPSSMEVPKNARPGDRVWVSVRGQMAPTMEATIAAQLEKAGVAVSRFEVDAQPEVRAARAVVTPESKLPDVALGYLDAQDLDPAHKALLRETFQKVVPA